MVGLSLRRGIFALAALAGCGRLGFTERQSGDDAARDDAASSESRANYAFVTAGRYTGVLGGVAGADTICGTEADAAGISGDYVALLWSADRPDPAALLAGSRGWKLPSGEWLADTPATVSQGAFYRPLNAFASGQRVDRFEDGGLRFWTGRYTDTCGDWRSATGLGDQAYVPQYARLSDGGLACTDAYRLACFERGHAVAPALPAISHARLFVTAATWTPGAGITRADALCNTEATAAGIGASMALLPDTVAAADRVPGARTTFYQQPDGILVGTLAAPDSYFLVGADRAPHEGALWTAGDPLQLPEETCAAWTSGAPTDRAIIGSTTWGGYGDINDQATCGQDAHLLCAEL